MSKVIYANAQTFDKEVLQAEKPVLVDFYADGCPPCNSISGFLDELSSEYHGKADIVKVNVFESGEIASRYHIRSVPQLIGFKNGKVVIRSEGARPKGEIEKLIKHSIAV